MPRSSSCCANIPSRFCKAAGLAQQNIRVVIINDPSFNAFVADGHRIFINSGALMQAKTPNEVIGVLAHESGHIAGGHLARMREEMAKASDRIAWSPCCSASAPWWRARAPAAAAATSAWRR